MRTGILAASLSCWALVAQAQPQTGSPVGRPPRVSNEPATLRGFTLRNESNQPIVDAQARTTTGKTINITAAGPIQPKRAQDFRAEKNDCIASVNVKFQNSKTISQDNINDCNDPKIVVSNDKVSAQTEAGGPIFSPSKGTQRQ
ncbi:MAG: hypothetical protein JOY71_03135 [Acetobacteraceae bacterium]|nr:hypothetical protein [Acetobacteraceae bacterium]MBV8521119.1 hypothetical protein [Acetobacteraceae bacterium]